MEPRNLAIETLNKFRQLEDLSEPIFQQITHATVVSVEVTVGGMFADISVDSNAVLDWGKVGRDYNIIAKLVSHDSEEDLADAILHFEYGKLKYLEISVHELEIDWDRLATGNLL
jgi:hypothetical protein